MTRPFHQDPTQFFAVVGAPYLRETHGRGGFGYNGHMVRERRTDDLRPRKLEIGVATICAAFCAGALGVLLFATSGTAKLVEVASQAVN